MAQRKFGEIPFLLKKYFKKNPGYVALKFHLTGVLAPLIAWKVISSSRSEVILTNMLEQMLIY